MYAYCGIDCEKCECYTGAKDKIGHSPGKAAEKWSRVYKMEIQPNQMKCKGCSSEDSELSIFCSGCLIRKCCLEKNVQSCSSCELFPCSKTMNMLKDSYAAEQFMKLFQSGTETCVDL